MAHLSSKSPLKPWRSQRINLLCCGFVRNSTSTFKEHFPCKDVSSIVAYYIIDFHLQFIHNHHYSKVYHDLTSSSIRINLKHRVKDNPHGCSMIIFKPFLSQLLNDIIIKQKLIQNKENKENKDIKKTTNRSNTRGIKLTIQHNKLDCGSDWYAGGGYSIFYGLIGVPKSNNSFKNNWNYSTDDLVKNIERAFTNLKFIENNSRITFLDINNKHETFSKFCAQFLHLSGYTKHGIHRCNFGTNGDYISTEAIECQLKPQDSITVCVDFEKQHLFFLYNSNIRIKEMYQDPSVHNGNIKLDFDKYHYLFGLSSLRCGCQEQHLAGFQFSVNIKKL